MNFNNQKTQLVFGSNDMPILHVIGKEVYKQNYTLNFAVLLVFLSATYISL